MLTFRHDSEKLLRKTFQNLRGQIQSVVKLFALDLEATQIAELANLNRNTVNRFLRAIRFIYLWIGIGITITKP